MDTVRLARDLGNVSGLLPAGVKRLRDMPFQLAQAMKAALIYLSWEEHVPKEDMPPRSIWTDQERVAAHFDEVDRRRKEKLDGREIANPVQNDAARMLIVG